MKKRLWKIKGSFKALPMRHKLAVSFSAPLIVLCILLTAVSSPILSQAYRKQVQYSVDKSFEQAGNFIQNHIRNLYYISELIAKDDEIQDNMLDNLAPNSRTIAEAYREFYTINKEFQNIEVMNPGYRIGMYVPDELEYSNNNKYFYAQSQLYAHPAYETIESTLNQGQVCYLIMPDLVANNVEKQQMYIMMLQAEKMIHNGEEHTHIIKVGVPVDTIRRILNNAKNTQNNLLYVLDHDGNLLTASEEALFYEHEQALSNLLQGDEVESWSYITLDKKDYYVLREEVPGYKWQIVSLIPVSDFKKRIDFVNLVMITTDIIIILSILITSFFVARYYVKRISLLNEHMKQIEGGNLYTTLQKNDRMRETEDEIDAIYENFIDMSERLTTVMKAHYKLGKEVMSAELKALQAQINPHFLYNTLDLINWGAMDHGAQEVAQMARNLGQFYRLSLNHGKVAITIEEELRHVEAYCEIEKVHLGGALQIEFDVPENIRQYACLNIILQPFVENSIIHGIAEHPDIMECNIRIQAKKEGEDILFTISDDGPGIPVEKIKTILEDAASGAQHGYGVKNINFRLKLCYGEAYGVTYDEKSEEGTVVHIKIPALTYEELEKKLLE